MCAYEYNKTRIMIDFNVFHFSEYEMFAKDMGDNAIRKPTNIYLGELGFYYTR